MSNAPVGSPMRTSSRAQRLQQAAASPHAAAARVLRPTDSAHTRLTCKEPEGDVKQPPARAPADPAFMQLLVTSVHESEYKAATGPGGVGKVFSRAQMHAAFLHIAFSIGVLALYPEQISSLLALFLGSHVFCLMATGFGKTFAYECLPMLYDYLYNGDPSLPEYLSRRTFFPVLIVINPLCSLMTEQVAAFNTMIQKTQHAFRAEHLSDEQKDTKVFQRAAGRTRDIGILHLSAELLTDKNKPYRGNLTQ